MLVPFRVNETVEGNGILNASLKRTSQVEWRVEVQELFAGEVAVRQALDR
jgi:hypothetical protein